MTATETAAKINAWDRKSVYELRDMLRDLNSLTDDSDAYIDMTSLPTAAIPDDVDTSYPVWAIDYSGHMLVGDAADDIMSLDDYRANR